MLALLLTLTLFLAWCTVGLAVLALLEADTRELRIALTAPILGSASMVVPLFVLSNAGAPMEVAAPPVLGALLVGSLSVLAWRRPQLSPAVAPVAAISVFGLALLGRPMLRYGFDWIANANGDMAFYVLSATHLVGHGLQSPVDYAALADSQSYSSYAQGLTLDGLRAGTQVMLAGFAASTGQAPLALYMPMSLAIAMCGVCATAALAMQAARKWWAASVAAALLVASPMAAYGVMQQLLPQNWGLGLAAALFAWFVRPEIHRDPGPRLADLCVITILAAAFFVVAYEVALTLLGAYGLFVIVLLARRRVSLRPIALLWGVPLAAAVIVTNTFLPRAIGYIDRFVLRFGTSEGFEGISQFGYAAVPGALPGALGLQSLFASPAASGTSMRIAVAAALLVGVLAVGFATAIRGAAAGIGLLGYAALVLLLARNRNDYGVFKILMYCQPFLAAAVAVWLSALKRRAVLLLASVLLVVVVGQQFRTLNVYVDASRNPIDLPNASDSSLLPAFGRALGRASAPVVSVTDNFALGMLEGASARDRRVLFLARNIFELPWATRVFEIREGESSVSLRFEANLAASRALSRASCVLVLPTGAQQPVNRRALPESSQNLVVRRCGRSRNTLVFVTSSLGQPATLPQDRQWVSFWQLERDPSNPGRTFAGFGRYALFQVLDATRAVRVALDVTATPVASQQTLPPAVVFGSGRAARLPLVGSGSARVVSPPLRPRLIDGQAYIVLDMGRNGRLPEVRRSGLAGLWGEAVPLDPRSLTSYVRDVSTVPAARGRDREPPLGVRDFPGDLRDETLEYSGIYEDGWIDRASYVQLACGPAGRLTIQADIPLHLGAQRLRVLVNERQLASRPVAPGRLSIELPLAACVGRRKVELRWARAAPIAPVDPRRASALLRSIAVEPVG